MSKASTARHTIDIPREWDGVYAFKTFTDRPREVVIPARYWLAAVPGIALCIGLLIALPNPVVMP